MDESGKLEGYFAIRIEQNAEAQVRKLPREKKRRLLEEIRKLIAKFTQEK